jgi:hypothetical protein
MEGVKVQISLALMPVLIGLGKGLVAIAKFLQPVTSNANRLKIAIGIVVGALIVWKVTTMALTVQTLIATGATEGMSGAVWALNVAMDANVIGLVVIAIIALVAGFVLAYKHITFFREAVDWTWKILVDGAKAVWGYFKKYWPYLLGIITGPFGLAAVAIYENFAGIKKFVLDLVAGIKHAFNDLLHYVEQIPHKLGKAIAKIPGGKAAMKAIGFGSSLAGKIGLAEGGLVTRAGGFLVGERGPELVSLPSGAAVSPLPAPLMAGAGGRGGGDLTITVPVYLDGKQVARSVAKVTADRIARR